MPEIFSHSHGGTPDTTKRHSFATSSYLGVNGVDYRVKIGLWKLESILSQYYLRHGSGTQQWLRITPVKKITLYPRYSSYSGHDRSLPPTPPLKLTYERPLTANKVVELACIITANATGAALASMGAEVIQGLYYRAAFLFMADKITTDLILDNPSGYARLTQLFEEADAIIQGYHLGLFARRE
ncbi:hypothetical protein AFLA70_345g001300 [Aspergillus flavus AF70]|nr:hypothetical protein AFLA70_345g001300 [Aspergillus flavus AF70]